MRCRGVSAFVLGNTEKPCLVSDGLLVVLALIIGGCGGPVASTRAGLAVPQAVGSTGATTTTIMVPTTTADSASEQLTTAPIGSFTTSAQSSADFPKPGKTLHLTGFDLSTPAGFDRLILRFDGDVSNLSYRIERLSPPIVESPSGLPIEVEGDTFFKIKFSPASAYQFVDGKVVARYDGPDRLEPSSVAAAVVEVVKTEDFEDRLSWVVGISGDGSYASALQPTEGRLIIDFSSS